MAPRCSRATSMRSRWCWRAARRARCSRTGMPRRSPARPSHCSAIRRGASSARRGERGGTQVRLVGRRGRHPLRLRDGHRVHSPRHRRERRHPMRRPGSGGPQQQQRAKAHPASGTGSAHTAGGDCSARVASGDCGVRSARRNGGAQAVGGDGIARAASGDCGTRAASGNGVAHVVGGDGDARAVSGDGVVHAGTGDGVVHAVSGDSGARAVCGGDGPHAVKWGRCLACREAGRRCACG